MNNYDYTFCNRSRTDTEPNRVSVNAVDVAMNAIRFCLGIMNIVIHRGILVTLPYNWGEPERAPHVRVVQRVRLYIYIYRGGEK